MSPQSRRYISPMDWAETIWNAEAGSKTAQLKLSRFELEVAREAQKIAQTKDFQRAFYDKVPPSKSFDEYFRKRIVDAESVVDQAKSQAQIAMKAQVKEWEMSQASLNELKKQKTKLNELLLKNDRKGIVKLVKAYLPWALMEPTERNIWRQWLEAIENPDPKRARLVFRGLGNRILRDGAGKPNGAALAQVLNGAEGHDTEKLNVLADLRQRIGRETSKPRGVLESKTPQPNLSALNDEGVTISRIMANHAINSDGSPLQSFSTFNVAQRFSHGKENVTYGAFLIDERRLTPNFAAYGSEAEFLVPLFVFPDEVAAMTDVPKRSRVELEKAEKQFWAQVEAKAKAQGIPIDNVRRTHLEINNRAFRIAAVRNFGLASGHSAYNTCSSAFKTIFDN